MAARRRGPGSPSADDGLDAMKTTCGDCGKREFGSLQHAVSGMTDATLDGFGTLCMRCYTARFGDDNQQDAVLPPRSFHAYLAYMWLFFAAFNLSKIPYVLRAYRSGEPLEMSSCMHAVGLKTGIRVQSPLLSFILPHIVTGAAYAMLAAAVLLRRISLKNVRTRGMILLVALAHLTMVWPNRASPPGAALNTPLIFLGIAAALWLFARPTSQAPWWVLMGTMWTGPGLEIVALWPFYLRPL